MKLMGASRVKRVDLDPCTSLWESESNNILTLNFVKKIYHKHLKKKIKI